MPRWYRASSLSPDLHILSRLPREVSELYAFIAEVNQVMSRVLLATIRDKGNCPCPRCLVPKEQLNRMGQKQDIKFRLKNQQKFLLNQIQTARRWIYEKAQSITSQVVEHLLKPSSSVPTMVCFKKWFIFMVSDGQPT